MESSPPSWLIFVTPTYDGAFKNLPTILDFHYGIQKLGEWNAKHLTESSSLLAHCFNKAWIEALAAKDAGKEPLYFCMLHADVEAKCAEWFTKLYLEMGKYDADIISAIIPIKSHHGYTSTAEDTDPWYPRKYTVSETLDKPVTWTSDGLLVNTGMMLVNMRGDWVYDAWFNITDRIMKVDNQWTNVTEPEDWAFSRMARKAGAKIYATRAVPVNHISGHFKYPSDEKWGSLNREQH